MRNRRQRLFSLVTNWLGAISLLGVLGYLNPGLEGMRLLFLLFPLALLARTLQARAASDATAPSLPAPPSVAGALCPTNTTSNKRATPFPFAASGWSITAGPRRLIHIPETF